MFEPDKSTKDTTQQESLVAREEADKYPFRLLKDERVLASYPITSVKRPLGHLVSFLFVTDARVIYAAEAKTVLSSSTAYRETRLDKVDGVEAQRGRGLSSLGAAIAIAIGLNVIGMLLLSGLTTTYSSNPYNSYVSAPAAGFGAFLIVLALLTAVVGVVVVVSLARASGGLALIGTKDAVQLAEYRDWLTAGTTVVVLIFLALFLPLALLIWLGARALGLFSASQAFLYADSTSIDAIAYDAGAVILDAQARGTLAGS
jgi:hypothetical protein